MNDSVIMVSDLIKRYGSVLALDGFGLEVGPGEVHGFLGPNGAGKTTMIRILLGLLRADSGSVSVFGLDPWTDATPVHARLAYVPGDVTLWPSLTGGEVIDLIARLNGRQPARLQELLERFELDPTKKCRTYSKGNRQKVALVAAFAAEAELLIFDEPTSGLDPLMEQVFGDELEAARQRGATVLLSSHILSEAERLCDRLSIIRAGRLVASAPLEQLRGARHSFVTAQLDRPPRLESITGLVDVELDGGNLRCRVEPAALDDLLRALANAGVRGVTITPPTLEEVFLSHYQTAPR
ncbi:ABC transporter ATP-binding protein [Microlunatus parietis]|uniref:ABC-2 type transport system ATP-binding protein n=1 Tax=Microlunatus parietis TaxID=682979 RepID=A0A7Y9I7M1_9ACTN|nr:ABC transporter ATP-binding protein [Microlunatus parietis]NYE71603.1 ABC-2 type transport system ATP-binding protein [Microlunatus parietis]